jgi:hypothetical protein
MGEVIMSDYSSHSFVLNDIMENFDIDSVLEFGCGMYSTPIFINNAKNVKSIEMQNEEWFIKVRDEFLNKDNFTIELRLDWEKLVSEVQKSRKKYDLIFIDGQGDSRVPLANTCIKNTDIIICHDTQAACYGWDKINKNVGNWEWFDIKKHPTETAIFTKNSEVKKFIYDTYKDFL